MQVDCEHRAVEMPFSSNALLHVQMHHIRKALKQVMLKRWGFVLLVGHWFLTCILMSRKSHHLGNSVSFLIAWDVNITGCMCHWLSDLLRLLFVFSLHPDPLKITLNTSITWIANKPGSSNMPWMSLSCTSGSKHHSWRISLSSFKDMQFWLPGLFSFHGQMLSTCKKLTQIQNENEHEQELLLFCNISKTQGRENACSLTFEVSVCFLRQPHVKAVTVSISKMRGISTMTFKKIQWVSASRH